MGIITRQLFWKLLHSKIMEIITPLIPLVHFVVVIWGSIVVFGKFQIRF